MAKPNPFLSLTTAAMALPAFAAPQPVETIVAIKATTYQEEDVPQRDVLAGSDERYKIDIGQFRLLTPVGEKWSLGVDVAYETMSGASPWGTIMGADGKASLIMSGATIRDKRTEVSLTATHHGESRSISVGLTSSDEDDYEARAVSISGEWEMNNKLSTLSLGMSYSNDDIEPTDALRFGRVHREEKVSRSLSAGWTQVLNKNSVVHVGLDVTDHDGYLSDPYKLRDVRPDEKLEWALSLKYRRYFDNQNAALHLDYRYYDDDWGINSHTVYTGWHQNIGDNVRVVPNVRYYSQNEADFYRGTDDFGLATTINQSSDFRLSGYGAYTLGVKLIYSTLQWDVSLSIDRYISDKSYGHDASDQSHPALLSFNMTSLGLNFRF